MASRYTQVVLAPKLGVLLAVLTKVFGTKLDCDLGFVMDEVVRGILDAEAKAGAEDILALGADWV